VRRVFVTLLAVSLGFPVAAQAHQPVALLASDTTADKGPLLVNGTVSFAIRASFTKANEVRAFRAQLAAGDDLAVQYLIIDKSPENKLKANRLPVVTITSPTGKKVTLKISERTKFYEPYSQTNYLYLSRYSAEAEAGIYSISIKSKAKSAVTVAIGEKEIPGEVLRGPAPAAKPSATSSPAASAAPTASKAPALTMKDVAANNTAKSCWSAIDGNVYDLTRWINSHPGGSSAITFLCGTDGSKAFAAQHYGQVKPVNRLVTYLLGPLSS
jgi:cytochrome b involved in lipid metabolism